MGVILRSALRLATVGLALYVLTVGALLWREDQVIEAHVAGLSVPPEADFILILGGGISPGADRIVTLEEQRRLIAALPVARARPDAPVLMSGGGDSNSAGLVEADLLRLHAIEAGIARERILVEKASVSTFENMRFSARIAGERGLRVPVVVTDPIHMPRALALWRYAAGTPAGYVLAEGMGDEAGRVRVVYLLREAAAWWLNLAKVAAWEAMTLAGMAEEARAEIVR